MSSEVEPSSSRVLVPRDDGGLPYGDESDTGADFARLAGWLQARWITVAGVLMVGAQALWFSALMAHSYFMLDDFYLVEHAASSSLTWNYLMWVNAGHLTPVGNALAWAVTRLSPYNWTLVSWVTLLLLVAAGLTLLRMLRTLFGNRPAILLLLAIYLLSPLAFPAVSWWTVSGEVLPLEIALFGAVTSHFHYMKTRRRRHLLVTVVWLLVAMASSDKGLAVPLLLFAITSAFMSTGFWLKSAWGVLWRYWFAWSLYLVTMAAYVAVYVVQLKTSSQAPRLSAVHGVFNFIWTLVSKTYIPGILGGPWRWFATGSYGDANPPTGLAWIALGVGIGIIVVSILIRLRAWRAWAILLAWIIVVDVIPVLLGRGDVFPGGFLGLVTRYVDEVPGLTALLAGLAFLPVAHSASAKRMVRSAGRPVTVAIVGVITAVLIGSIWSFHAYLTTTTSQPGRSYFATARLALAQAPSGTVIVNAWAPGDAVGGLFVGAPDGTEQLFGPLDTGGTGPRFVQRPDGTYDHLMEFDVWGRLVPAGVLGAHSPQLSGSQACWNSSAGEVEIPLQGVATKVDELRIGYLASAPGTAAVTYAGQTQAFHVSPGLHAVFLPATGSGGAIAITGMNPRQFCVGDAQVGVVLPSATGTAIPAMAASG